MDKIKQHKMEIVGDITMEKAYLTYSLLREEVKHWQDERGTFWMERFSPAGTPPYYQLVDIPDMTVLELWKRLNRVMGVVVSESVLGKTWNGFKANEPVKDPELLSCLQIALSGIAHLFKAPLQDENEEECTGCPICGEAAAFSVLTPPNGKRYLHCTVCGHEWPTTRVGCVRCGSDEASEQNYLNSGEFQGIDVVVCEACGEYFKELDLRVLSVEDFVWEDVRTLPLNYAAEQWLSDHASQTRKVQ